jgi:CubicO group peptidase (beta-lactamase class C family)
MYLNRGTYGGRIFFSDTIIQKFTSRAFLSNGNRRGLGFDKPEPDPKKISPASSSASSLSFGHSGFTGTLVWIDPQYNLIYIFLSNRIHPDQFNSKLVDMDVRTQIQEVVYKAIR